MSNSPINFVENPNGVKKAYPTWSDQMLSAGCEVFVKVRNFDKVASSFSRELIPFATAKRFYRKPDGLYWGKFRRKELTQNRVDESGDAE